MFSDTLQDIMKAKNVSQKQIADLFGVSQAAVSQKFARNSWSAEDVIRLFKFMNCHLIVLLDDSNLKKLV